MNPFRNVYQRWAAVFASLGLLTLASAAASAEPAMQILRGAHQQATYGSAFSDPLVVWVTDPVTKRPITGVRVNFVPGRGIGLSPSYAITDEKGLASVTATGMEVCTSTATAQIDGVSGASVQFDGLQVDKATLTVVPDDIVVSAGSEVPSLVSYAFTGFVGDDTPESANISGSPALTTTAANPGLHANYAIKGNPGTLSSPNYTFVAGFGTLAILGSADGSNAGLESAFLAVPPEEHTIEVRSALANQRAVATLDFPAFIAGLRGESGVFVRAAIWPQSAAASRMQTADTRSAILTVVSSTPVAPAAPVRAVELANTPVQANTKASPARLAVVSVPLAAAAAPRAASPAQCAR